MTTPRLVIGLLIADVGLTLIYLVDYLLGRPFEPFSQFVDLDGEANLPTWYASVQWFCAAAAYWVFARQNVTWRPRRSWLLVLLPAIFLAFSLDEVAGIHEFVGYLSDALLPNGERDATLVSQTGLFFLIVGIPFGMLFAGIAWALLPFLSRIPAGRNRLLAGMAAMLIAATGIEALSNLFAPGSGLATIEIAVEEMTEMVGATVVLWGGLTLIERLG